MNSHQARLLGLAAANLALVLLFPPYDYLGLGTGRAAATFDAFYFVFDTQYNRLVNAGLLFLELAWIILNAALGWLLLRSDRSGSLLSARSGVLVAAVINLAVILLLPPFENYASVLRISGTYFDGFYPVLGDKWKRNFYVPLLYLEVFWLLVNAAFLWLLLRPQDSAESTESAEPPEPP